MQIGRDNRYPHTQGLGFDGISTNDGDEMGDKGNDEREANRIGLGCDESLPMGTRQTMV